MLIACSLPAETLTDLPFPPAAASREEREPFRSPPSWFPALRPVAGHYLHAGHSISGTACHV